jgi:hypothetical protein
MTGKAGLKAGLIGTGVMLVWTVIGRLVPISGVWVWVSSGVSLLMYAGIGVLAGVLLSPPRAPGKGAGAGAIAGLMTGLIAGGVGIAILMVQISSGGNAPGMTPQQMAQIRQVSESGIPLAVLLAPSAVCIMAMGSGLAAIGGAILSAVKPD